MQTQQRRRGSLRARQPPAASSASGGGGTAALDNAAVVTCRICWTEAGTCREPAAAAWQLRVAVRFLCTAALLPSAHPQLHSNAGERLIAPSVCLFCRRRRGRQPAVALPLHRQPAVRAPALPGRLDGLCGGAAWRARCALLQRVPVAICRVRLLSVPLSESLLVSRSVCLVLTWDA